MYILYTLYLEFKYMSVMKKKTNSTLFKWDLHTLGHIVYWWGQTSLYRPVLLLVEISDLV